MYTLVFHMLEMCECILFAGKALMSIHAWGSLFRAPCSNTTVSFQTQHPAKNIGGIIISYMLLKYMDLLWFRNLLWTRRSVWNAYNIIMEYPRALLHSEKLMSHTF